MKKVSIITINFNQIVLTIDLLESLSKQTYSNIELIVVDNGYKNDDSKILKNYYPNIKLIRSERNLGFAGANNIGIKNATGELLFFINNDTIVPQNSIEKLVQAMSKNCTSGVICPLIVYHNAPSKLQYAGYTKINPITGRNKAIDFKKKMIIQEKVTLTPYAHGAAMMVTKDIIEKVGFMPENYFLYYEELDWSKQITGAGYKIYVYHGCHILHKESMTIGKASPLKVYFQTRNRILFMRRNCNLFQLIIFITFFGLATLPKTIIKYLIGFKIEPIMSFIGGVWWNIINDTGCHSIGFKYDHINQ
ncbi:MAG: glycosyltransferase family 2 protein [Cyclobacteriaceae bacterium]